jgi:hypothetical protein
MNNQEILDNVPKCKSATFYAEFVQVRLNTYAKKWGGEYKFWDEKLSSWTHDGWKQSSSKANFRSLADIKRIAELEKELDNLNSGTDDLYNMVFEHVGLKLEFPDEVDHTDIKQLLKAHNIEQQAKGCTDGAKACSISFGEGVVIGETELDGYAKDLLRQAKALKEPKT